MEEKVTLEWSYTPADYFEASFEDSREHYALVIDNGRVEAVVAPDVYDANPDLSKEIHQEVRTHFLAVQLIEHRPFSLSHYRTYRMHADGRRDVTVHRATIDAFLVGERADVRVTDTHGNVIRDTKAERIRKTQHLAALAAKYRQDPTVELMLSSYGTAVNDPDKELVHLYQIRDALTRRFNTPRDAIEILRSASNEVFSGRKWERLGVLANDLPLLEGRHVGRFVGELRHATQEELSQARQIASLMIEAYLNYLEQEAEDASRLPDD